MQSGEPLVRAQEKYRASLPAFPARRRLVSLGMLDFRRSSASSDVLNTLGVSSRQLEIAMTLEETALKDDYFISHKLYPNVDFYSGIIYKALGVPVNMFTVMFAIGRMPGWIAQYLEMRYDGSTRIARPRQIYTGATERPYIPVVER